MEYCIVKDGVIVNMIVTEADFAGEIGSLPAYEGARIGDPYIAPPPQPTAMDRLEAQVTYTAMMTDTLMEG